jgi:hypothetical protein
MATVMAAATAVTMVAVAATKTIAATVMVRGIDNNQLEGAAEEAMPVAMVKVVKTATATEMVTVTATIMIVHQRQQWGRHARDVPCYGGGGGNVGGEGGGKATAMVEVAAMAAAEEACVGRAAAVQCKSGGGGDGNSSGRGCTREFWNKYISLKYIFSELNVVYMVCWINSHQEKSEKNNGIPSVMGQKTFFLVLPAKLPN